MNKISPAFSAMVKKEKIRSHGFITTYNFPEPEDL